MLLPLPGAVVPDCPIPAPGFAFPVAPEPVPGAAWSCWAGSPMAQALALGVLPPEPFAGALPVPVLPPLLWASAGAAIAATIASVARLLMTRDVPTSRFLLRRLLPGSDRVWILVSDSWEIRDDLLLGSASPGRWSAPDARVRPERSIWRPLARGTSRDATATLAGAPLPDATLPEAQRRCRRALPRSARVALSKCRLFAALQATESRVGVKVTGSHRA